MQPHKETLITLYELTQAQELGKESFLFAFFMDKSKDERARGVTIACTTREFFTESYHYTIIDAPGHRFAFFELHCTNSPEISESNILANPHTPPN